MLTGNVQRQQLIHTAMMKGEGEAADIAINLWRPLASQLISIIGEGGFIALYARSVYLTQATFPWLASGEASHAADIRFNDLKINLEGQNVIDAKKASHMLFLTFTNILASLIGEPLTASILCSAWDSDASDMDIAGKEFSHE